MCVAAVMEVILVAMQLYEQDTGDSTVWDYLPMRSSSIWAPATSRRTCGSTTIWNPAAAPTPFGISAWA